MPLLDSKSLHFTAHTPPSLVSQLVPPAVCLKCGAVYILPVAGGGIQNEATETVNVFPPVQVCPSRETEGDQCSATK